MKSPKRRMLAAGTLVVFGVLVAVATAMFFGSSRAKPRVGSRQYMASRSAVSERLEQVFGALRGGAAGTQVASMSHSLPEQVAKNMRRIGLVPSAAAYVAAAHPVWIVPGSVEICVLHLEKVGAGSICGTISAAEQRGLAEGTENATGESLVIGLVPNGNASVSVTMRDGTTESVPVEDNIYEIVGGAPASVTLTNAAGARITRRFEGAT